MSEALPPLDETADVVIVGAGPGGSATAASLARAGLDVLLLDRGTGPREQTAHDVLTPRAVRELDSLGVPTGEDEGWRHARGLRVIGAGMRVQLDWPESAHAPSYGVIRPAGDLDEVLARHASRQGARVRAGVEVIEAIRGTDGRVVGVRAREVDEAGVPTGATQHVAAPVVVAADHEPSTWTRAARGADRPAGVAVTARYTSPRHDDDRVEAWLDVPYAGRGLALGRLVGLGEGTCSVGLSLTGRGAATSPAEATAALRQWVASFPREWACSEDSLVGPIRSAILPARTSRRAGASDGVLRVGDAARGAQTFTGGRVAHALESARRAADAIVEEISHGAPDQDRLLAQYARAMTDARRSHRTLARGVTSLVDHPHLMRLAVAYGLPSELLTQYAWKAATNLSEPHGGIAGDRVRSARSRVVPAA